MIQSKKLLFLGSLLIAGTMLAAGCSKGRPPPPPIDEVALVGQWRESADTGSSNRRARAAEKKEVTVFRQLTLNADKSFVFSLCDKAGKPIKSDKKVEGTFLIDSEQHEVIFTVTNNGFKSSEKESKWGPATSDGPTENASGEIVFTIYDQGGMSTKYKRVN